MTLTDAELRAVQQEAATSRYLLAPLLEVLASSPTLRAAIVRDERRPTGNCGWCNGSAGRCTCAEQPRPPLTMEPE